MGEKQNDVNFKMNVMRGIVILVLILSAGSAGAEIPKEWNKTFGGIGFDGFDKAYSVQQTSDGGFILAGITTSYGAGRSDAWLIKTDANGDEEWNKTFGGTNLEEAHSVQQTSDGGFILAGRTMSYGISSDGFTWHDAWLIKTDANGDEEWNKTFGGTEDDVANSVQQTSDGGYIIAGSTESFGAGFFDAWLIKTDENGNEIWNRTWGSGGEDTANFVRQTSDGGYILAGGFSRMSAPWPNMEMDTDEIIIKTDANGYEQWSRLYPSGLYGGNNDDQAYSVQQTSDGGYILVGYTESYVGGVNHGDVLLIKIDSTGLNDQWFRRFGGTEYDLARSVQQTSDGGYIIAGSTKSYGAGLSDAWLIKTDANGDEEWNKTFGGAGLDEFFLVRQTSNGDLILAGATTSFGGGSTDAWLIRTALFPDIDLVADAIEVVQVVQDKSNSVPLLENKRTVVRGHVHGGGVVKNIVAQLWRVDADGKTIGEPILPANPFGRITILPTPAREKLDDAYLFELPPEWATGTLRLRLDVNPFDVPPESNRANNQITTSVMFLPSKTIKVTLVDYRWRVCDVTNAKGTVCAPGAATIGYSPSTSPEWFDAIEAELRRQLPIANLKVTRREVIDNRDIMFNPKDATFIPGTYELNAVDSLRQTLDSANPGTLFVWLSSNFIGGVSWSRDYYDFANKRWNSVSTPVAETVVHEVGHQLGRKHTACSGTEDDPGPYPYPGGRIGGPAGDIERYAGFSIADGSGAAALFPGLVGPTAGDIMSYCHPRWPSDYTYRAWRESIEGWTELIDPVGDFMLVSGSVAADGSTGSLATVSRLPQVASLTPEGSGPYLLRLLDVNGGVLAQRSITPTAATDNRDDAPLGFVETFAWTVGTRRVELVDANNRVLATQVVSANAPEITQIDHDGGTMLAPPGSVTISWAGSDADGDALRGSVQYSRDGGATWQSLVSDLSSTTFTTQIAALAGTKTDQGRFRVLLSDGVLTDYADTTLFTVRGHAPRVLIASPLSSTRYELGQSTALEAVVQDPEDGPLDGVSVQWTSSIDGALGAGRLQFARLSPGTHQLTATATDAEGVQTSASVTVSVGQGLDPGSPPVVDAGADRSASEGDVVSFYGMASDPDDDSIIYSWSVVQAPPVDFDLEGADTLTPTLTVPDQGTYTLRLTVSDGLNPPVTDDVTVTVATPISACTAISSPGTYVLTQNIINSTNSTCISITSNNVIFDGAGYKIDGADVTSTYGVYVYNLTTPLKNVTVKNLKVMDWYFGIYYSALNGSITNNTASNNFNGIYLNSTSNNNLNGNIVSNNLNGIYLSSSSNNSLSGNNISKNSNGIYLNSTSNNNLDSNRVANNDLGIYLSSSSNNSLNGNDASNNTNGIYLSSTSYNSLNGNIVSNNLNGIYLSSSSNNSLSGNTVSKNSNGIYLNSTSNNNLDGNRVANNDLGIYLSSSSNNNLSGNNVSNNTFGISLYSSSNNKIYHNNIIKNTNQAMDSTSANSWDSGYPSGGNYWSDYTGADLKSGLNQDQPGSDGIGDIPYQIPDGSSVDRYPLMIIPSPVLTTITVSPVTASVVVGNTQYFSSDPRDQYGDPIAVTVIWSSSDTNVGTIDSNGLFTARASGTTTITAASGTVSGTATVIIADNPKLLLTMTASLVEIPVVPSGYNEGIDYSYKVENIGNIRLIGPVTVDDDKALNEACLSVTTTGNLDSYLDPTEYITCTARYTITQADFIDTWTAKVTNHATANADGITSNEATQTLTYVPPN